LKIILCFLFFFPALAFACNVPEQEIEKHFRQQWDDEGQVTTIPIKLGKQKIVVLSHIDSCGQRGCDYSFYYLINGCAEEGLSVAGEIVWNENYNEFSVRRRPLPTESNKGERIFQYNKIKKRYLEL
jgi:hypothetical protein